MKSSYSHVCLGYYYLPCKHLTTYGVSSKHTSVLKNNAFTRKINYAMLIQKHSMRKFQHETTYKRSLPHEKTLDRTARRLHF
jgi:hypothetical protein